MVRRLIRAKQLAKARKLERAKLDVPLEQTNRVAWQAWLLRQRAKGKR